MPLQQFSCAGSLQFFLTFCLLETMKDLIKHFDVPIMILSIIIVLGGGLSVVGYISDAQKIAAYQKALETIKKCRSSKTGDINAIFIDDLCGKVPTPADFGIVGR